MKKRKNGFTLVELLAVILVMGIVTSIGIFSFMSYMEKSKEKLLKIEVEQIKIAANAYIKEVELRGDYKYYIVKDEVTGKDIYKSCVSISNLQSNGYYNGDLDFKNSEHYNSVVMVQKIDGVTSYEVVIDEDDDNNIDGEILLYCWADSYSGDTNDNSDVQVENKNPDDTDVNLDVEIEKTVNDNEFDVTMSFDANVRKVISETVTVTNSDQLVDVMIILDNSGSMGSTCDFTKTPSTHYEKAAAAAKSLSNEIRNNFKNSRIGLIQFNNKAELSRGFSKKPITNDILKCAPYTTNTVHALALGLEQFINDVQKKPDGSLEDVKKYVILLTDGIPNESYNGDSTCYNGINPSLSMSSDPCSQTLLKYSNLYQSNGVNVLVIGYGFSNYNSQYDAFREMASSNIDGLCNGADYKDAKGVEHCYYSAGSNNISNVFKQITESIQNDVVKSLVNRVEILGTFSDDLIFEDSSGNVVSEIRISVDVTDDKIDINNKLNETFQYRLKTKNVKFDCDIDAVGDKVCSKNINVFDSYKLVLYNDDKVVGTYSLSSMPTITVSKGFSSYLN